MKLNGLTNNLKGNDSSLSNAYLQHIVELLRKEVEQLSATLTEVKNEAEGHIEEQKTLVKTETVNADVIKRSSSATTEIALLNNVINVLGQLNVNGNAVLTDATFRGPFTYKGDVTELPTDPNPGDVYIVSNEVHIWNGTDWDTFNMPVGSVSRAEYDENKEITDDAIDTLRTDVNDVSDDLTRLASDTRDNFIEVAGNISNLNTNKLDKNPVDGKTYVRKDTDWIEMSAAQNTVKAEAGESVISNEEEGVNITSPKIELNSEDIKVNGVALTEPNKFALTKTKDNNDEYKHYELEFKRSPFAPWSSEVYGYTIYDDGGRFCIKNTLNAKWTVTTKDYQYRKACDEYRQADNSSTYLTSMDKDGNIKSMYFPSRQLVDTQQRNMVADWIIWNPEYCPTGFENKAYLFFPWTYDTATNKAFLLEYDNGDFASSYDLTTVLTGQGATLQTALSSNTAELGEGGKSLRTKDIQRICWISHDTANGGTYAIILGGDLESNITDPFDPTKCIYITLPAGANPGYGSMAATDKAWYLSEYGTGRIMRITPNGRVTEYNLSKTGYQSSVGDYIEYTDKNGRPACAFRRFDSATNGKEAICFFEEREDGGVNFDEVDMTPYVYTGRDSSNWRMMENDYYIFFTCGYGYYNAVGENDFPSAANAKKLWYWDKATHTTHIVDDFYGIAASDWAHSYMGMYKTRENAIWVIPHIQTFTAAQRTGELKYIPNTDFTDIDPETGKDLGSIEFGSVQIGVDIPWFTCNNGFGWNNYAVMFHDTSSWGYTSLFAQYACVNDDGIGFLMSPNYKAFVLFYGNGNYKVYKLADGASLDSKSYDFNANYQQMMPDELDNQATCLTSCEGLKHGWLIRARGYQNARGYENNTRTNAALVYVGIQYKNGEPNILKMPTITILRKQTDEYARPKHMYDYYGHLLTYDDYERRNKVMRGTFMDIAYGWPTRGIDGYYKEKLSKAKNKLNLTYDNEVISSVDD